MAASVPWHRPVFVPTKPDYLNHRFDTARISRSSAIRAFRRGDFDSFARRVASGEALRDAWRSANEGIEQLTFETRRAAERIDRRYAISSRIGSAARAAAARALEIDVEIGISRRWRSFSMDFSRNWPRVCVFPDRRLFCLSIRVVLELKNLFVYAICSTEGT